MADNPKGAGEASQPSQEKPTLPPTTEVLSSARRWAGFSYLCTLALIVIFLVAAMGLWTVGNERTYPVSQAIEWNWRARATNNLVDMATNLNRSLEILGPFSGNPSWWFPKPDTDFDQIKLNIAESRDTALTVAATEAIGSFGYQQAVQNLQETIVEINEHLELAKSWFVWTPAAAILLLTYFFLTVLATASASLSYRRHKDIGLLPAGLFALVWILGSIAVGAIAALIP